MKDSLIFIYIHIILLIKFPSKFSIYRRDSPIFYTYKSRGLLKIIPGQVASWLEVRCFIHQKYWAQGRIEPSTSSPPNPAQYLPSHALCLFFLNDIVHVSYLKLYVLLFGENTALDSIPFVNHCNHPNP